MARVRLGILLSSAVLASCAQKSYVAIQQIVPPPAWKKVAILPFSGDEGHAGLAQEVFHQEIANKTHLQLFKSDTSEVHTLSQAQKHAQGLDADAFIHGSVISEKRGKKFDAFTTIDLVESKSGRVIASIFRPSGELLATSEEECVTSATERAARDMVKAIERLHLQKP